MKDKIRFIITQYLDGNLDIECEHLHYAFRDDFNFYDFPRADLFDRMIEIQEHCYGAGVTPIFVIR